MQFRSTPRLPAIFPRIFAALAALLCSLTAVAQFTPNDPYFFPDLPGTVTMPGYYGQWHLQNRMPLGSQNAGVDANVWGAWERGLTGNGVIIAILDDGTQGDHPEFASKFRNEFSWDWQMSLLQNNAQAFRGMPVLPKDNHGTAVAGVAAALGGNGLGVTGAAPFAQVAAQRFLVPELYWEVSENQVEVWAIGFQGQQNDQGEYDPRVPFTGTVAPVRVMNHSYGPDEGYVYGEDWEKLHPALAASAALNVIHVYSAGNQRNEWTTQDSNTILSNTSPDVIVVAALGSDGKFSDYSSFGANVLVTAPSSSKGFFRIATTDRSGVTGYNTFEDGEDTYFSPEDRADLVNYASNFGGTSSAAPLVSGIMALGVEANPNLNLRMARHLLAKTNFHIDPTDPGWITNAAGFHFNAAYGFGLIDADAFTLRATNITGLTPLTVITEPEQELFGQTFSPARRTLTQIHTVNQPDPLPLEYVQVNLAITGLQPDTDAYFSGSGAIPGDLSGVLTSPAGTTYSLFSNDRNLTGDFESQRAFGEALVWTFTSYAYYGEQINGNWTLSLHNASPNQNSANFGEWISFQLIFGTGLVSSGFDWWGRGNDGAWGDAANWMQGAVPAPGEAVYFAGTRQTTVDTQVDRAVGSITFASSAGAFTINNNSIEIDGDITNFSSATQTINSRIVLAADSNFRAARGDLTLRNIVLGDAASGHTLTVNGPANTVVTGTMADGTGGPGNLIKSGTGTLTLQNPALHTGFTRIENGTLASSDIAASTVQLVGGFLSPGGVNSISQISVNGLHLDGGGLIMDLGTATSDRIALGAAGISSSAATDFIFSNAQFQPGTFVLLTGPGVGALDLNLLSFSNSIPGMTGTFSLSGNQLLFTAAHSGFVSGPILENRAPVNIPEFATFIVNGFARTGTTSDSNTIGALDFAPGSELRIFNTLNVQRGQFTVREGIGTLSGDLVSTPGDFSKLGDGTLLVLSWAQVGGNLFVPAGTLIAGHNFSVTGNAQIGAAVLDVPGNLAIGGSASFTGSLLVVSGQMSVGAHLSAQNTTTQIQGQLRVAGRSEFSGGSLTVNGLFQSAGGIFLNSGAALFGTGTLLADVNNQGTLSPGNSPGLLTIWGNFVQTAPGSLLIEAASTDQFDQLHVTGTAQLGGTLEFLPLDGFTPEFGQQFSFLQAGQITGDFDSIVVPATYRGRFLAMGNTGVLLLAPDSYTRVAVTPNQTRVARALDSYRFATSGDREVVSLALDLQSASQYPAAFDAISPAFHQNVADLGLNLAQSQGQLLLQQFSSVRLAGRGAASGGAPLQPLQHDKDGKSVADPKAAAPLVETGEDSRWSVWTQGNGIFGRMGTVAELPSSRFESGGFLVGADYAWAPSLLTGVFVGYQGAVAKYGGGSDLRMNGVRFGGYATFDPEGSGFYLDAAVWGGSSAYQVHRPIAFSTVNRNARSKQTANEFSTLLGGGYDWQLGKFTFGPAVSAQFTHLGVNGFTETGAQSLNLRVSGQSVQSLETYVGARIAYTAQLAEGVVLIPEVRMFWQHEYLQNGRTINASLDGGNGANFGFATSSPDRDAVWAGVGATLQFRDRWSAYAYYNNDFGRSDFNASSISGGVRFEF